MAEQVRSHPGGDASPARRDDGGTATAPSLARQLLGWRRLAEAVSSRGEVTPLLSELTALLCEHGEAIDHAAVLVHGNGRPRLRAASGWPQGDNGAEGAVAALEPEALRARGVRAVERLPLVADTERLGELVLGSLTTYTLGEADRALAAAVARRAAAELAAERTRAAGVEGSRTPGAQRNRRAAELAAVIEALPDGVLITDAAGQLRQVNAAALALAGISDVGALGGDPLRVAEALDVRDAATGAPLRLGEDLVEPALRGRAVHREVLLRQVGTGAERHMRVVSAPIRALTASGAACETPDGTAGPERSRTPAVRLPPQPPDDSAAVVLGAVVIASDVTAQRTSEQELRRAADFSQRLIGILGHDLRNPLGVVTLSAGRLLQAGSLSPTAQRSAARIARAAERMERMVADLLDWTRVRVSGTLPVECRPMSLPLVLGEVIDELGVTHPGRRIELDCRGGGTGRWDPDRITQALGNLLANALEHGPEDAPVRVSCRDEADAVVVAVHNRGEPIPEELRPHLFDPFRRAGQRSTGLGLGLYIVREIVRAHGGTIAVHSSAGTGTTFTVRWPRDLPQQP